MLAVSQQKFKPGSTGVSNEKKRSTQGGSKRKVTKGSNSRKSSKVADDCVDILAK